MVLLSVGGVIASLLALQWEARWRGRRLVAMDPHNLEPHHIELSDAGVRAWTSTDGASLTTIVSAWRSTASHSPLN